MQRFVFDLLDRIVGLVWTPAPYQGPAVVFKGAAR